MLVKGLLQFVAKWARHLGDVAFFFVLFDAGDMQWTHDRPRFRLALVFAIAFVVAVLHSLTRIHGPDGARPD